MLYKVYQGEGCRHIVRTDNNVPICFRPWAMGVVKPENYLNITPQQLVKDQPELWSKKWHEWRNNSPEKFICHACEFIFEKIVKEEEEK